MRPGDFLLLLRRQPFQPFRVHLTNGTIYEIRHPDLALVGRSIVWLQLPVSQSSFPSGEQKVVIALLHIVHVDFLEPYPFVN
jgi:hypothetical protein